MCVQKIFTNMRFKEMKVNWPRRHSDTNNNQIQRIMRTFKYLVFMLMCMDARTRVLCTQAAGLPWLTRKNHKI